MSDAKGIIGRVRKMKAEECEMTGSWEYFGSRTKPCAEIVISHGSCDSREKKHFSIGRLPISAR